MYVIGAVNPADVGRVRTAGTRRIYAGCRLRPLQFGQNDATSEIHTQRNSSYVSMSLHTVRNGRRRVQGNANAETRGTRPRDEGQSRTGEQRAGAIRRPGVAQRRQRQPASSSLFFAAADSDDRSLLAGRASSETPPSPAARVGARQ